jgi:hypothetical protein
MMPVYPFPTESGILMFSAIAEALQLCLDTKLRKDQVSQKASLPHMANAANQVKPRAAFFCPEVRT